MSRSFLPAALLLLLGLAPLLPAAAPAPKPLDSLVQAMTQSRDDEFRLRVLRGMNAALQGKHGLPAPAGWDTLYEELIKSSSEPLRQQAQTLGVVFGGKGAMEELRTTLANGKAKGEARLAALQALVSARDPRTLPLLLTLVKEPGPLRPAAIRGLSGFDDAQIPAAVLAVYPQLGADEKRDALATLAGRPAGARALLAAIDAGTVPRTEISAAFARQLGNLNDPAVNTWLQEHWGAVHTSSAEKQKEIARLRAVCTPQRIGTADKNHGRALFAQTCALCHTIFGAGAKIGPELPGAFEDVEYLLLNIVDPNAIIGKDYQQTVAQTKNGQTVIGIIGAQDRTSLTLKTLGGPVILQRDELEKLSLLDVSLMPEGLLSGLQEQDVLDLFVYLRQHGQVSLLANETNVNDFNNDTAFERWIRSSARLWSVKEGVLTGRASGDRAEFVNSDFVADRFRFSFEFQLNKPEAVLTATVTGQQTEDGFTGARLVVGEGQVTLRTEQGGTRSQSSSAMPFQPGQWVPCTVETKGKQLHVQLPGKELNISGAGRTNFAFGISGPGAELQLRAFKLELLRD